MGGVTRNGSDEKTKWLFVGVRSKINFKKGSKIYQLESRRMKVNFLS
jgi:hypothetical protein